MSFKHTVTEKAKSIKNSILLLPESNDNRILQAASIITEQQISSRVILLGVKEDVKARAENIGVRLNNQIEIVDPSRDKNLLDYTHAFYELRKHKGLTLEQAEHKAKNSMYFAAMMMRFKKAHAMVAGAITTTADVLRPAFQLVGKSPHSSVISSCFVLESKDLSLGHEGQFIFSDCAIIPTPTSKELVSIALASAHSCTVFLETMPIVSLLSFSTLGSASHNEVDVVRSAVEILKKNHPDLLVDGELQFDAAIIPETGKLKAPSSPTAGKSNTLVFPNLASGNIGYKIAKELGNLDAYGPFVQGLAAPINDLSRGCNVSEIIISCAASLTQHESFGAT